MGHIQCMWHGNYSMGLGTGHNGTNHTVVCGGGVKGRRQAKVTGL